MTIFSPKRPKYGEDPNFVPNTIIGEGVTLRGVIKGSNAVMISGLVFGDINVDGEVIVTETGYVKGDISSTFAVISGIVEGNIILSSYASLKSTASVTGDITCTALNIEDGAVFAGVSNMIVKSSSLTKKLKRINEQAAAMENWTPRIEAAPDEHEVPEASEENQTETQTEAQDVTEITEMASEIETADETIIAGSETINDLEEEAGAHFPFELTDDKDEETADFGLGEGIDAADYLDLEETIPETESEKTPTDDDELESLLQEEESEDR